MEQKKGTCFCSFFSTSAGKKRTIAVFINPRQVDFSFVKRPIYIWDGPRIRLKFCQTSFRVVKSSQVVVEWNSLWSKYSSQQAEISMILGSGSEKYLHRTFLSCNTTTAFEFNDSKTELFQNTAHHGNRHSIRKNKINGDHNWPINNERPASNILGEKTKAYLVCSLVKRGVEIRDEKCFTSEKMPSVFDRL